MQIQKGSKDVVISLPLQQCGKALQHLQDNLSANLSSRARMESVLVSCLILMAFSFSFGDAQAASCHLQAGYQLLHDWQKVGMYNSPVGPTVLQTLNQPHLEWLPVTERRHGLEVSYFWPVILAGNYDLITSVKTPEEAGGIMVILGWLVLQIRPKDIGGRKSPASRTRSAAQATLDRIAQWKIQALQSTVDGYEDEVRLDIQKTVAIFDIWAETMLVKILTDDRIEKGESRYDSCLIHFKRIIQLVKVLLKLGSLKWTRAMIVTPIFFCAFKCRDWYVRREALALMTGWEREEGIWSVSGPALVLARLIEIESKNLTPIDIVPEQARIDATRVDFLPQEAMVRFWFRRALPTGLWRSSDARWVWDSELISY
ncbi:hypothetical protein N7540_010350 [Penicillium herquei]|nr:hypothetical protein N7540_010350 [Penicillium herquei]